MALHNAISGIPHHRIRKVGAALVIAAGSLGVHLHLLTESREKFLNCQGENGRKEGMKEKPWKWIPPVVIACIILFGITAITGMSRPSSIFCRYKIYKQTNGTYQVWYRGRSSWCEQSGLTYEQAKALQIEKCKNFFKSTSPAGEWVK